MKTAVCPCGAKYRLQRGSTGKQEGDVFAPSFCLECGEEFDWSEMREDNDD